MNKLKLLFLSTLMLTLSCSKESEIRLSEFEIPIITGFELRDVQGQTMGIYGIPNIKLGNESNSYNSEYFFSLYPNPCTDICTVYIKAPNSNAAKYVWIVQAQYRDNNTTILMNLGTNSIYVGGTPLIETEFTTNNIVVDLSSLSEGYYRMYLKVDDLILFDNLVITNNKK